MEQCHGCPYHVYWSCRLCAGFSNDFLQTCILKGELLGNTITKLLVSMNQVSFFYTG